MKKVCLLVLTLTCSSVAMAQELIRGPYLQFPTSSSMKVLWRTATASPARVYYGTSVATVMDNFVDVSTVATDHVVNITGLQPYTEYFYAVSDGTNVLGGGDATFRFRTSPTIGTVQPISVWAIGDFGKGSPKQTAVMDSYRAHVGEDLSDVWIWLGDNVYYDGLDEEYQEKVFNPAYGMTEIFKRLPFMPAPGNHDYGVIAPPDESHDPLTNDGPYFDIIDVPTNGEIGGEPSGHELFYSFDYGNVHFVSLNSEIGSILSTSNDWTGANIFGNFNGSPMTEWIHADLQANTQRWTVVYFHQPPHSEGSHSSSDPIERYMKAMRDNICPILESYGVDVVMSGHSHVYERSFLLNGFFGATGQFVASQHAMDLSSGSLESGEPYRKYTTGPDANKGTIYVVQGNSGSTDSDPALSHPAMHTSIGCDECVGSTLLYVHGDTLKGKHLSSTGDILDEYAIIKQETPSGLIETPTSSFGELEVCPNPFNENTMVRFETYREMTVKVDLVSMNGQVIHTFHSGKLGVGLQEFSVNSQSLNLAKGAYLVRVSSDNLPAVARLIKME